MFDKFINRFLNAANRTTEKTSDVRYAHPSHDPRNLKAQSQPQLKSQIHNQSQPSSIYVSPKIAHPISPAKAKVFDGIFKDKKRLKELTVSYLTEQGRKGSHRTSINQYVVAQLMNDQNAIKMLIETKWVRDNLAQVRKELKAEGRIGYSYKQDIWYIKSLTQDVTDKEKRFLSAQGLGKGWRRISSEIDAIQWLYQNFTPDEFENFCVSILTSHCNVPFKITEKRRFSGADGGFDGTGHCEIDGKIENVALQAKRYACSSQVGEDQCDRFVGALVKEGLKHGFMITTGTFSQRTHKSTQAFQVRDIWIELIDQNRLAKIMLKKTDQPHGFGLHATDKGFIYINEAILRKAASAL